jgi:hypothetical protein
MLTERSFVLIIPPGPEVLGAVRHALSDRLSATHGVDEDLLVVAAMLVRQAQSWPGGDGPIRLRTATCGRIVHLEASRGIAHEADDDPACREALHALVDVLVDRAERFTVSAFAGSLVLSAQRVMHPDLDDAVLDIRNVA